MAYQDLTLAQYLPGHIYQLGQNGSPTGRYFFIDNQGASHEITGDAIKAISDLGLQASNLQVIDQFSAPKSSGGNFTAANLQNFTSTQLTDYNQRATANDLAGQSPTSGAGTPGISQTDPNAVSGVPQRQAATPNTPEQAASLTATMTGGLAMPDLKQYHVGGTYYGYDSSKGYLVAFQDIDHLKQYFPDGIDKNAPELPSSIDPGNANQQPGSIVQLSSGTAVGSLTPTTSNGTGTGSTDNGATTNLTATPTGAKFADSDAYKSLTPEQQQVVNSIFNVYATGTQQQAQLMIDAVSKASANADPYFKALLDLTLGEIGAHVADVNKDYETKAKIIAATQKQLVENVNAQKDFLSLSEQSDLSKIAQNYESDVLTSKDKAAETGKTFGSGYGSSEYQLGQLADTNNNVVQSTKAQYNYQLQALQTKADQGDESAKLQLENLTNTKTSNLNTIGGNAEETVGSANTNVPGYTPVGGVIGSIEESKQQDILTGVKNYFDLNQPAL